MNQYLNMFLKIYLYNNVTWDFMYQKERNVIYVLHLKIRIVPTVKKKFKK